MDEMFIKRAFETSGENIVSVKVIRNKATGQTLGYGFIEFANSTSARDAMLKLNGKLIPGAPVSFIRIIRPLNLNFKLNKSFCTYLQIVLDFMRLHIGIFCRPLLAFSWQTFYYKLSQDK